MKCSIALLVLMLAGCDALSKAETYTLYRGSMLVEGMRVHVATFDVPDTNDPNYNQANCQLAAELFMRQDGVKVRFWCEKGRFEA